MNKQIYLIRHGEALHNVLFNVVGNNAYTKFFQTSSNKWLEISVNINININKKIFLYFLLINNKWVIN